MENRIDRKHSKHNRRLLIILAVILLLALTTGGLVARFVTQNKREAQMVADEFYISSNYLEIVESENEEPKVINVGGWGAEKSLEFQLYNHQKENLALIAAKNISYKINLGNNPNGWEIDKVVDHNGQELTATDGIYILPGDGETRVTHTITLKYTGTTDEGNVSPLTVTVEAVEPYTEELSAKFQLTNLVEPQYKIEDKGEYCLVTIHSNDYYDNIEVRWDRAKFSPDNTNSISASWKDSNVADDGKSVGSFQADPYHTYELIFVKKTNESFNYKPDVGNTITLY